MNWEQHKATVVAAIDNAFRADPNDGIATLSVVEAMLRDLKEIRSTRDQAEKLARAADERSRYLTELWAEYDSDYLAVLAAAKTLATGTTVFVDEQPAWRQHMAGQQQAPSSDNLATYMTDQSGVI